MIYIVTALHPEARPLLKHFKLKRDATSPKLPVFSNERITLCVSGFGSLRSAIATSALLTRRPLPPASVLFNVGIAGCRNTQIPLGSAFLINKVIDHDRQTCYYPNIVFNHTLPQATLESFNYPINHTHAPTLTTDLVDMEAAGCFEAAMTFLPVHRVHAIKIVSDHLQIFQFTKTHMETLIAQNITVIENTLESIQEMDIEQVGTCSQRFLNKL